MELMASGYLLLLQHREMDRPSLILSILPQSTHEPNMVWTGTQLLDLLQDYLNGYTSKIGLLLGWSESDGVAKEMLNLDVGPSGWAKARARSTCFSVFRLLNHTNFRTPDMPGLRY